MAASSTVVIKVKYGDTLRRFNVPIADDKLVLNMEGLRKKILSLFSFAPDTELMLAYIDEDSDVVALVDDDDLRDVVKQGLNPLRITVKLNNEMNGSQYNHSTASSTPLRSPRVQPLQNLNAGISEILRKVPEPLRETLVKFSDDLASKASSSAPGISELVDVFSKVSLSYLGQISESQGGVKSGSQSDVPESSSAARENKDSELKIDPAATLGVPLNATSDVASKKGEHSEKFKPESTMKRNEVKINSVTGRSMEESSLDCNSVTAGLDSQNINVAQPGNDGLRNLAPGHPKSDVVSNTVGKKEKVKNMVKCSNGKSLLKRGLPPLLVDSNFAGKDVCNSSEPKLGQNCGSVGASDPTNGDHVNGRTSVGKSSSQTWAPHGGLNFGSFCGPSTTYECPFSGTALESISFAPPQPASDAVSFRRRISQNDGSGNTFHRGVRCDGCGIHPIIGPRFKSKVKLDYDLCRVCFEEMGNDNDYIRMDRPAVYRHPHVLTQFQQFPHVYRGSKVKPGAAKLDSRFIQDVNIFDGTVMEPSTPFTKIWRMRNSGTAMWPQKSQLLWIGGDKLSNALSVEVQIPPAGLLVDEELDIAVDFISPELPGRYISYWRLASPSGQKFGQRVWVLIQVDASVKESPRETVRNLNLNLPPIGSSLTGPEIINVDPEPTVEDSHRVADNSKKVVESGKPDTDQELKFPINDSLLVGNGASTSVPSPASPSVSYPIIDLSDVAPAIPSVSPAILRQIPPRPPALPADVAPTIPSVSPAMLFPIPPPPPPPPAPFARAPPSVVELPGKNQVEEKLLRELEEMGFKQIDLNKEILRMNEYDFEQSVDDLCGVSEWDPILEELEEMGFDDTEMNKKLLKKNNGSIKRVVMDLIAGEKI